MEHVELMKIYKRVCKQYRGSCNRCILSSENNGTRNVCCAFMCDHPEKAEEILLKWDKEHPQKTRFMDIKERCPSIVVCKDILNDTEFPVACAQHLGYVAKCPYAGLPKCECQECWNAPMED